MSVNLYHRGRKRPALNVEHLFPNVADLKSPFAPVFERPTLRGCQCGDALGRVKPLRTLTLPCQKTNPDGVICGCIVVKIGWLGKHSGVSVYKVGSCGLICGYMIVKIGWRDLGLITSERSIMF